MRSNDGAGGNKTPSAPTLTHVEAGLSVPLFQRGGGPSSAGSDEDEGDLFKGIDEESLERDDVDTVAVTTSE